MATDRTDEHSEPTAQPAPKEKFDWGPPVIAIGTFFVITGAIAVGVFLFLTGRIGRKETIARKPTVVRIVERGTDAPLGECWLLVRSTTDRRILGEYQKLVGRNAVLQSDADGTVRIPESINKHDNLDLFVWKDGFKIAPCRRFVKKSARPRDMFVIRGEFDSSRELTQGEPIVVQLRPVDAAERKAVTERMRKELAKFDTSILHGQSLPVEALARAIAASE